MDPPSNTGKRRKLSLFNTIRVLNGGSDDDLVTPFNTPLEIVEDGGSDTEDEEDEQTAQYYLNKMRDDTDRPKQTVFGEGVEVWKSYGGTIYADLTDQVKRKMREEETWNAEAMATVAGGLKRKMGEEADAKIKNWMLEKKTDGKPIPPDPISMPPAPILPPTEAYPDRDPSATRFHFSSAGIDPLGAHARPIKPLPRRSNLPRMGERLVSVGVTGTSGSVPVPHADPLTGTQPQVRDGESPPVPASSPSLRRRALPVFRAPREGALETRTRRVVSGSFGSFEGGVGRFDERKYRLGQKKGREKLETVSEEGEDEDGEENVKENFKEKESPKEIVTDGKKPDLFKGKPWLKR
ncbi:hypothetical protein JI435_102830 [Parastagonospora nodorum SN15]|uniref:Uncharacterized protein n=1 Tax=Phaeosphaeria nodorum (strain SN15 / ATCC MYA-4574 / FGSC 10173) TaxID=321614 RepID=A0A7U2FFX1_PHANO|nr:hypothetical protein JI435_102830 [Parastagonospora nodorum SN15]